MGEEYWCPRGCDKAAMLTHRRTKYGSDNEIIEQSLTLTCPECGLRLKVLD